MRVRTTNRAIAACVLATAAGASPVFLSGCTSTRIAVAEKLGYAKREQLVDRVEEARDSQQEAKQQFESALAEFLAVTGASGGELEAKYEKLKAEYDKSESRAEEVRSRIDKVEAVADALFREWDKELDEYSSSTLRSASERQLKDTRRLYDQLIAAMNAAEEKMQPVLDAFKDQVLFLKHNLNARAVAALGQTVAEVRSDVSRLVAEMEASIAEADEFIRQMNSAEQ